MVHPELQRPARVQGDDAATNAPKFRVYAYKTEFLDNEVITTQEELFKDLNRNGVFDALRLRFQFGEPITGSQLARGGRSGICRRNMGSGGWVSYVGNGVLMATTSPSGSSKPRPGRDLRAEAVRSG